MSRFLAPSGLVLALASVIVLSLPAAARADADPAGPTVRVSGTLLQTAREPRSGGPYYAVRTADGDTISISADFPRPPAPLSRFTGSLEVPATVQRALGARGLDLGDGDEVSAASAAGRRVLALVDESAATMTVVDSMVRSPADEAPPTTTTHRVFLAVPENLGARSSVSDAALLTDLRRVTAYWQAQSGGRITSFRLPTRVVHYSSTVPDAQHDCGFGDDFFDVLDEAASRVAPDFDPAVDQLVVGLPAGDCSDGPLGLGTVGDGFASGGALIATLDPEYAVGAVAHEMGHNYGLLHANVRCGEGCSDEYYDIFEIMGFGLGEGYNPLTALSTVYRVSNGVTAPGEVESLDVTARSATRRLGARSATSGLRGLAVVDPRDQTTYYVDYRSGLGTDAGAAYAADGTLANDDGTHDYAFSTGVVVQQRYDEEDPDGGQVGTGGTEVVPFGDRAATRSGQTWTSPSGGLTVTVARTSSGSATVRVASPAGDTEGLISPAGTPQVSGVRAVGRTLTAQPGDWAPGASLDYEWRTTTGTRLSEARSWVPSASSVGRSVTLTVTGIADGHQITSRTTPPFTIGYGTLSATAPRIVGTAKVGRRLTVARGYWTAGTTLSQTWYVGGRAVSHAGSVTLGRAARGKRVVVSVVGRKAGYRTLVRSTPATAPVRR